MTGRSAGTDSCFARRRLCSKPGIRSPGGGLTSAKPTSSSDQPDSSQPCWSAGRATVTGRSAHSPDGTPSVADWCSPSSRWPATKRPGRQFRRRRAGFTGAAPFGTGRPSGLTRRKSSPLPRVPAIVSDDPYTAGLLALGALGDVELDPLVLVQATEAVGLDLGEVDEDFLVAAVYGDEAEALVGVEPLHCSLCHVFLLLGVRSRTVRLRWPSSAGGLHRPGREMTTAPARPDSRTSCDTRTPKSRQQHHRTGVGYRPVSAEYVVVGSQQWQFLPAGKSFPVTRCGVGETGHGGGRGEAYRGWLVRDELGEVAGDERVTGADRVRHGDAGRRATVRRAVDVRVAAGVAERDDDVAGPVGQPFGQRLRCLARDHQSRLADTGEDQVHLVQQRRDRRAVGPGSVAATTPMVSPSVTSPAVIAPPYGRRRPRATPGAPGRSRRPRLRWSARRPAAGCPVPPRRAGPQVSRDVVDPYASGGQHRDLRERAAQVAQVPGPAGGGGEQLHRGRAGAPRGQHLGRGPRAGVAGHPEFGGAADHGGVAGREDYAYVDVPNEW